MLKSEAAKSVIYIVTSSLVGGIRREYWSLLVRNIYLILGTRAFDRYTVMIYT